MRRLLLSLILLVTTILVPPALALEFDDVPVNHPNQVAVDFLSSIGVFKGQGNSTRFNPQGQLNRAEWAVLLARQQEEDPTLMDYNDCFPDVSNSWFAPAVCLAFSEEWIKGYKAGPEAGKFIPTNPLTVAELVVILDRVFFWPIEPGPHWFSGAVNYAIEANIIRADIDENHFLSRAEAAEILFRTTVLEELDVERYDPLLGELLASNTPTRQPDSASTPPPPTPPTSSGATVHLKAFADQPLEGSVTQGALYVPAIRFQLQSQSPATLKKISIQRGSFGKTNELGRVRLLINGKVLRESQFNLIEHAVIWDDLNHPISPSGLSLVEMNVDFNRDIQGNQSYQFRVDPSDIVLAESGSSVLGKSISGPALKTIARKAESVTIKNIEKGINKPFTNSTREVIGRFTIITGAHEVLIKRIMLQDDGDLEASRFSNFRLVAGDRELAFVQTVRRKTLDFFVNDYLIGENEERNLTVLADVSDRARTHHSVRLFLDDPQDLYAFDLDYGYGSFINNQFGPNTAYCAGSQSTVCEKEGLRKRCSHEDRKFEEEDCEKDDRIREEEGTVFDPGTCPQVIDPVCGILKGKLVTFNNLCLAEGARAVGIEKGTCQTQPKTTKCDNRTAPVCGKLLSVDQTFTNRCLAEQSGATSITPGPCKNGSEICSGDTQAVCGIFKKPPSARSFPNRCFAELAKADDIKTNRCPEISCLDEDKPVCAIVNGKRKDFKNECEAYREEPTSLASGKCDEEGSACGNEAKAVCATAPGTTERRSYLNRCHAEKMQATDIKDRPCEQGEFACAQVFSPVCGTIAVDCLSGACPPVRHTFSNSCHASLAGATSISEGNCE